MTVVGLESVTIVSPKNGWWLGEGKGSEKFLVEITLGPLSLKLLKKGWENDKREVKSSRLEYWRIWLNSIKNDGQFIVLPVLEC